MYPDFHSTSARFLSIGLDPANADPASVGVADSGDYGGSLSSSGAFRAAAFSADPFNIGPPEHAIGGPSFDLGWFSSFGAPASPSAHKTTSEAAAQITRDNYHWGSSLGSAAGPISFGFRTVAPTYSAGSDQDIQGTFTAFTAVEEAATRMALATWASLANITFTDLGDSDSATMEFGNYSSSTDGSEAFAYFPGSSIQAGDVAVNTHYANTSNFNPGTYEFEALMHEIGHALGLEHPGSYNAGPDQTITYDANAEYVEDTRMYSLMSYFSSSYTGGSYSVHDETPMLHDIAAIQRLYGANTSTRTGDSIYGFHSNAGSPYAIGSSTQHVVFTIYDMGGNDTLDLSGYSQNQTINLNTEQFSSVGGDVYNVCIAVGTNIENAIGGTGNDIILPNVNLIGSLTGGGGNDTFASTLFGLSAYTITDLNYGDRLDFTDAALSNFLDVRIGTAFSYGAGSTNLSLTLSNNPSGHLYLGSDGVGGVYVNEGLHVTGLNDFNGDGHSDLLWRNGSSGTFTEWRIGGNTTANQETTNSYVGTVATDWKLEGSFDFNGDGVSDLVWRNSSSGVFSIWDSTGPSFTQNSYVNGGVGTAWAMLGFGDFNGDGKDDVIWRNTTSGVFTEWQSTGSGYNANAYVNGGVDTGWKLVGAADFNGDGKSDLLWRNAASGAFTEWQSTGSGFNSNVYVNGGVDTTWHVAATADFNGDGKDDILFRNNNGTFTEWQSTGSGFTSNVYVNAGVDTGWQLQGAFDFNDDGKADLIWRNTTSGAFTVWQSTGSGFTANVLVDANVSTDWSLIAHHYDVV